MKLIIDIPEDVYTRLKAGDTNAGNTFHTTALEAIGNGTHYDTSGDRISRSALKKAIEELEITEELVEYDCDDVSTTGVSQYLDRPDVLDLIDNAPAVDPNKELKELKARAETYKAAYRIMSSAFEGEVRKTKRQQGEWEKCQNDTFRCSNCRQADEVPTAMGTPIYNFCPNCGSDMRKGGTE